MNNDKFSRREFMRDGAIAAAGLAAGLGAVGRKSVYADAAKENRPNILFIYTDDQGSWTPEYAGNKQAHTPNMDRLRREGADFVNAFVTTSVCSPSRTTLITGRYASELRIYDWIRPESDQGLDRSVPVWPALLKKAGYQTGLVGKWHLGHREDYHPTHYGYDYFMGFLTGGTKTANPTLEMDGDNQQFKGLTVDILTDHALAFIDRHEDSPFLLSLHYRAPHGAYLPVSEEDWSHFEDREISVPKYPGLNEPMMRESMRKYLASIASIDRNLGRLLTRLDELDIAEHTVVILTSDNGYNLGHHGLRSKGNALWGLVKTPPQQWPHIPAGRRPNMFDTSLKIPLIIRWPGVVQPGMTINNTVSNLDWFPTICDMAGVEIPEGTVQRGRSFVPLLRGQRIAWNDDLYGEYNMLNGAQTEMRVYRTPQWKLMRDFKNPGRAELYNLVDDPDESVNLIDSEDPAVRRIVRELDHKILEQMRRIVDPLAASAAQQNPK